MANAREVIERWFEEVWNQRRLESIDELLHPDAEIVGLPTAGARGPAAFKPFHASICEQFETMRIDVVEVVEDGDTVAASCRAHGRHRNGNAIRISGMSISTVRDGQLVGSWNVWEFTSLQRQIAGLPAK